MLMQYVLDNSRKLVLPRALIVSRQLARFASPRAYRSRLCARPLFTLSTDRPFEVLSGRVRRGRKGPRQPLPIPLFTLSAERQRRCPNSAQFRCNLSPLDATLLSLLLCVANKELAQYLSPLNATLTKNIGGRGCPNLCLSLLPYLLTSSPRHLVSSADGKRV